MSFTDDGDYKCKAIPDRVDTLKNCFDQDRLLENGGHGSGVPIVQMSIHECNLLCLSTASCVKFEIGVSALKLGECNLYSQTTCTTDYGPDFDWYYPEALANMKLIGVYTDTTVHTATGCGNKCQETANCKMFNHIPNTECVLFSDTCDQSADPPAPNQKKYTMTSEKYVPM